jgi:hypothetical protein
MSFKQSKTAANKVAVYSGAGAMQLVPLFADYDLGDAGNGALAGGDIIEMLALPAGYVPVDGILVADDLDDGATLALDVGILSADWLKNDSASTIGAEFIAGSVVGQAGGIARFAVKAGFMLAPADNDRAIGIKVATAPAVAVATGKMRLIVNVRPQIDGA